MARRGQRGAAVVPFPGLRLREGRGRRLPSSRSLLACALLVALAGGLYLIARETSVFAVRTIDVRGTDDPAVEARVRQALAPLVGSSLVSFDRGRADRLLFSVAQVAGVSFDRDFPHSLRVSVRAERPVAVLRKATEAWLVSASGRVLRRLDSRPYPRLPRIWVARSVDLSVNATVGGEPAEAVQAATAAAAAHLPGEVLSVKSVGSELTLVLDSGTEVRLGSGGDARLKLAVARRILPLVPDAAYVDVSVPERSVTFSNPQVSG